MRRSAAVLILAITFAAAGSGRAQEAPAGPERGKGGARRSSDMPLEVVTSSLPEDLASQASQEDKGWLPFYVELRALRDRPVVADLTGVVETPDGTRIFTARRRVDVPPGAPTRAWLYLPYGGNDSIRMRVKWTAEGEGATLQDARFTAVSGGRDQSIPMIVVGEHTRSTISPWGDSALKTSRREIGRDRMVRMEEKQLPNHLLGYRGVSILVLRNFDEKVMDPAQLEAIRHWVFLGGWVILVPSPKGEIFRTQLLSQLLPAAKVGEPGALVGFVHQEPWVVGRRSRLEEVVPSVPSPGIPYPVVDPLELEVQREIRARHHEGKDPEAAASGNVRLYLEAACGAGRVGVMTFDDLTFGEPSLEFRQKLWSLILDDAENRGQWAPAKPEADQLLDVVKSGLKREVGVWAIVALVVAYLVIIGPGLYLLLKRLGRLPSIVWVEPLVVVVYLGIIAATAYITKGFLTKVQSIHVVHHPKDQPYVLEQSYLGLFSAEEASYRVTAPRSDELYTAGGGALEMEQGEIGKGLSLRGFRLAKWATGTFGAWALRDLPGGRAGVDVEAPGGEEAEEITVKNGTGAAIRQGFLRLGGKVLSTGEIPAGVQKRLARKALVEVTAKTAGEDPSADPFGGDRLSRRAVDLLLGSGTLGGRAEFVGLLDREEEDFQVDQPTNLDHRLDLWVEYR